jgi:putative ABC transport system permease protein
MRNLFKVTIRNFTRKPVTNIINLVGLSVSLALVIILSVYCYRELTTDNFQEKGDRVYLYAGLNDRLYTPGILKDHIDMSVPGVESTVRIVGTWGAPVFKVADKEPITSDLLFADEDFFKLFTYKVVEGNPESALKEPMSVVITKTLSEKLFGNESATGKTMKFNNDRELTIKAVIEEPKDNSCLSFNAVTSNATRKIVMPNEGEFTEWGWCDFQTFVLLKKGINPELTAKSILSVIPKDFQKDYGAAKLTPFKKLYFSRFQLFGDNYLHCGDQKKVMILLMVAILVLMVAMVNFFNISSSQWLEKIRQTGLMKVIGASRSAILRNTLSEAFLFFLIALLLAIILIGMIAPFISNYTGIQFNKQLIYTPSFLMISIAGTFVLSLIIGLVPAAQISSSRAIDNLKSTVELHSANSIFRSILVAAQFTISIVLIAFTILVQKQVNYGSSSLGFNQKNIIGIKLTPELDSKKEVMKKLLSEKPTIGKISFGQFYPGNLNSHWTREMNMNGEKKEIDFDTFSADSKFFGMMGLELKMGRFYSDDLTTDADKVVVNETFLRDNKLPNPIGCKFISIKNHVCEIIGVVKDFHYESFNKPIAPLAIRNEPYVSYCLASLQTNNYNSLHQSVQEIKAAASDLSPSFPVEISFLDQAVGNLYHSELSFRRTFSLFAGCAIVICCLGILAMSLFACQRRIKEIGIRRVNGASVSEVMTMLNQDFVKWVAIAFVIATPIAYFAMGRWLENFAYKTNLSWWIFALSGAMALGIALLTVSWQSWKAATRNPVEALRYE